MQKYSTSRYQYISRSCSGDTINPSSMHGHPCVSRDTGTHRAVLERALSFTATLVATAQTKCILLRALQRYVHLTQSMPRRRDLTTRSSLQRSRHHLPRQKVRVAQCRTCLRPVSSRPHSVKDRGYSNLRGVGCEAEPPNVALRHTSAAAASASSTACVAQSEHRTFGGTAVPADTRAIGTGRTRQSSR